MPLEYINQYKNIYSMTKVIKNNHNNYDFIINKELNEVKSIPYLEIKTGQSTTKIQMQLMI